MNIESIHEVHMKDYIKVCVIGHRKVVHKEQVKEEFLENIKIIKNHCNKLDCLFGSKSEFNDLCYDVIDNLKKEQIGIRSVFYRCKHETAWLYGQDVVDHNLVSFINNESTFDRYDEIILSEHLLKTTKNSYIQRNFNMIDNSDICIFYYDEGNAKHNSGTKLAYDYAKKKQKMIINLFH